MTTRNAFDFLLACVIVLAFVECAQAQPAPAASAATSLAATPDTACGAAGTGYVWRYEPGATRRTKSLLSRPDQGAKPGAWAKRVDAQGGWVGCRMPPKAPDCVSIEATAWGGTCKSNVAIKPGDVGASRQVQDSNFRGRLYLTCERLADGSTGWVLDSRPGRTYCR